MKINWFRMDIYDFRRIINSTIIFEKINNIIMYLKIGLKCKDCGTTYTMCSCEDIYLEKLNSQNKLQNFILDLIIHNVHKIYINIIISNLHAYIKGLKQNDKAILHIKNIQNFISKLENYK